MISGGGQRWLSVKASLDSPGPRSGFTCLAMAAAGLHSPRPGRGQISYSQSACLALEARPAAARLHLLVPRSAGPRFAGEALASASPEPRPGPRRGKARFAGECRGKASFSGECRSKASFASSRPVSLISPSSGRSKASLAPPRLRSALIRLARARATASLLNHAGAVLQRAWMRARWPALRSCTRHRFCGPSPWARGIWF